MNTTTAATLSKRDRAVLHAVAAGRCQMSGGCGPTLVIDGMCYADQFAGARLIGGRTHRSPPLGGRIGAAHPNGQDLPGPAWRTPPSTAASAEAI
jgi:hypothetical protein